MNIMILLLLDVHIFIWLIRFQEKNNVNYNFVYNFHCEQIKKSYNHEKFNCVVVLIKKRKWKKFLKLMENYKDIL